MQNECATISVNAISNVYISVSQMRIQICIWCACRIYIDSFDIVGHFVWKDGFKLVHCNGFEYFTFCIHIQDSKQKALKPFH